jgi:cold shock CspA family protein
MSKREGYRGSPNSTSAGAVPVQGVIKTYDPVSGDGVVMSDTDFGEYDLAPDALAGSILRMLRPGQRVVFDLDASNQATTIRLGSEADMGTPGFPPVEV